MSQAFFAHISHKGKIRVDRGQELSQFGAQD